MNVYYGPDEWGLRPIGALNPVLDWEFCILQVWKHEDGRLFWAQDSGCSCPIPFEDFNSLDDLNLLTNETWDEFQTAVENHYKWSYYSWDEDVDELAADRTELLAKVAKELR